jgi:formate hydrogenlyase transcriptional activator
MLESEGIRSLVALPLRTAHRWLGSLGVGSRRPDAFSQEEVEFFSLVAGEVALAIDDAYHLEALQQERDRLRMLLDISNAVTSNLDLPDLLRAISANLRSIMQSDGAGVALMEEEGKQLRLCVIDSPGYDGTFRRARSCRRILPRSRRRDRVGPLWRRPRGTERICRAAVCL